jgi:hypothetical protein
MINVHPSMSEKTEKIMRLLLPGIIFASQGEPGLGQERSKSRVLAVKGRKTKTQKKQPKFTF